jgi:hypothetical protein
MSDVDESMIKKIEEDVTRRRDEERSRIENELRGKIEAEIKAKQDAELATKRSMEEKAALEAKLKSLEEQQARLAEDLARNTSTKKGVVSHDSPFKNDPVGERQINVAEVERASEQAFYDYLEQNRRGIGKKFK